MLVPETFRKSAEHRKLYATMSFLADVDPAGPILKGAHDREVVKAAVDRQRTILEHRAADMFKAYFREERAHVLRAISQEMDSVDGAIASLEDDLRETYESAWGGAALTWGEWAARRSPRVRKAGPPDEARDAAGRWTDEGGGTLFHGTSARQSDIGRTRFKPGLTYLAPSHEEAGIFAANPILSGQRGGIPRVHEVRAAPGRTKDIGAEVDEELMGDGHVDERIAELASAARREGYRYLTFQHPGLGDDYFAARVSLYPHEDLKIVATRLPGDKVRKAGPFAPGEPASDYGTPIDAWLRKNAGKRITGITERSRKAIAAEIAEGTAAGETLAQIARRVDKFYLEDVIPNRGMVIARTEVGGATNWMQDWIARDTADRGVPMEKEWLSLHDDRTRETHREADGQVQPLDEPFLVGGDELMYPGDESLGAGPEEIIQCRCSQLHRVVDEQPRHKAAVPSPAEFAKSVLGVENADVAVALAYAKGVFGEADEWTHARKVLMKHVNRLRRAARVEKYDAAELRDRLGRWARDGGGTFNGMQESGVPGRPDLALITDHQTGSTGAIRLDEATREKVHAKLREIRSRFAAPVEKYDLSEPRDDR